MAARLVDLEAERPLDEEVTTITTELDDSQPVVEEDLIPEKYRGKTAEELVRMHQESEKLLGRQSSEVGELRSVVDTYIQTQLASTAPNKEEEEQEEIDYFTDPASAMQRAIDNHPKIKAAEQHNQTQKKSEALARLKQKHPDMNEVLQEQKFSEWVQASKVRTRLYVEADQQFDYDSADELISLYKERKGYAEQTVNAEKLQRKQEVKAASTGTARGSGEAPSRKKYRRSDIVNLMKNDPARYQALSEEILQAYAENRVIR